MKYIVVVALLGAPGAVWAAVPLNGTGAPGVLLSWWRPSASPLGCCGSLARTRASGSGTCSRVRSRH